jgi:hypothetical protein
VSAPVSGTPFDNMFRLVPHWIHLPPLLSNATLNAINTLTTRSPMCFIFGRYSFRLTRAVVDG